jgi:hypothetical protein
VLLNLQLSDPCEDKGKFADIRGIFLLHLNNLFRVPDMQIRIAGRWQRVWPV